MKKLLLAIALLTTTVTTQTMDTETYCKLGISGMVALAYHKNLCTNDYIQLTIKNFPGAENDLLPHKVSGLMVDANIITALMSTYAYKDLATGTFFAANSVYSAYNRGNIVNKAIGEIKDREVIKPLEPLLKEYTLNNIQERKLLQQFQPKPIKEQLKLIANYAHNEQN